MSFLQERGPEGWRMSAVPRKGHVLILVCNKRLPKTNFQQAHTETVDIVLHDEIFSGKRSNPIGMLIQTSLPGEFAFSQSFARCHSETIESDEKG
jgi:hypothetical protein